MSTLALAHKDLRDIVEVEPLNARDADCLEELRAVLLRHGAIDRFGITLLHDHFPVYDGETLLETCDVERRTLTMQAVATTFLADREVVETEWRFRPTGEITAAMTCGKACVASSGSHAKKHVKVNPVKS